MGSCNSTDEKEFIRKVVKKDNQIHNNNNYNNFNNKEQENDISLPQGKCYIYRKSEDFLKKSRTLNFNNNDHIDELKYTIELYLTIKSNNPKASQISVGIDNNIGNVKNVQTIGETEVSEAKPEYFYNNTFFCNYFFERSQILYLNIKSKDYSEILNIPLAKIMGSRTNSASIMSELNNYELIIGAKKVLNQKQDIKIHVTHPNYKDNMFFILSNINDDRNWRKVYKSEEEINKDKFDPYQFDPTVLCRGDYSRKVLIEFYNTKAKLIGKAEFIINDVLNKSKSYQIGNGETKIFIETIENMNFADCLLSGMEIELIVGVDLTRSNGNINEKTSLHYIYGTEPTVYERAIRGCVNVLYHYDNDKKIPLLGFGCIPNGMTLVEHSFPLTFQFDNPFVSNIEELISVYRSALTKVNLYGPTVLSPLINNAIKASMSSGKNKYLILLILTDGMIDDIAETTDAIIEASYLPISIVIVGIGKNDFSNMVILDGDDLPLRNQYKIVQRDIVQFVEFNKFENNPKKLAEEVFYEIPRQVEEYYRANPIHKS